MTIYVVKTSDGDVYFSTIRSEDHEAAVKLAVDQVTNGNSSAYDISDVETVRQLWKDGKRRELLLLLQVLCVYRMAPVRSA